MGVSIRRAAFFVPARNQRHASRVAPLEFREIAMNYQDPPIKGSSYGETNYERAVRKDTPQPDLELASAEGNASVIAILGYFAALVFVICFVLYGLNHQGSETPVAAAPAAQAPAANNAAPPAPTQQPNPQQGNQGGPNPAANQKQAQPQQNPPPAQQQAKPANGQQAKPANGQQGQQPQPKAQQPAQQPPAAQPQAPAPKQ
jgi:hypothetical protein